MTCSWLVFLDAWEPWVILYLTFVSPLFICNSVSFFHRSGSTPIPPVLCLYSGFHCGKLPPHGARVTLLCRSGTRETQAEGGGFVRRRRRGRWRRWRGYFRRGVGRSARQAEPEGGPWGDHAPSAPEEGTHESLPCSWCHNKGPTGLLQG